jgi:hypothetical protein
MVKEMLSDFAASDITKTSSLEVYADAVFHKKLANGKL